jgi:hypothetical protein
MSLDKHIVKVEFDLGKRAIKKDNCNRYNPRLKPAYELLEEELIRIGWRTPQKKVRDYELLGELKYRPRSKRYHVRLTAYIEKRKNPR